MSKKKKHAIRAPLSVIGGIRAQTAHGTHLHVWWSRRWTEVLENFNLGARLGRGRNYAISGQVSSITIREGYVSAHVQGSHREPYESVIRFQFVQGETKERIVQALQRRPVWIARLLVGTLPFEVEAVFQAEGCPLFPRRKQDLMSQCSCPDWANPCKHLAAVYYLLGEVITKNPMILLTLRGVSRTDLIGETVTEPTEVTHSAIAKQGERTVTHDAFYGVTLPAFEDFGDAPKAALAAPLIHRLGPLPFWRGQERFIDTLEHLYTRAASRGWAVWAGEPIDLRREEEKVIIKGANLHLKQSRMRVDTSL